MENKKHHPKKKGIKIIRVGADDSVNDDDPDDDLENKIKSMPGIDPMQAIENLEIPPEEKRAMKEKLRLETLIKKYEMAVKHREIREKVTPRDNTLMSNSLHSSQLRMELSKHNSLHSKHLVSEFD